MTAWLTVAMYAAAGLLTLVAAVRTVADRPVNVAVLAVAALVEVVLLVQLVVGVGALLTQDHRVNAGLFVAYLLGILVVVPVAVAWSLAERSRWGMGVVVVGGLSLLVLVGRLQQLWSGRGA